MALSRNMYIARDPLVFGWNRWCNVNMSHTLLGLSFILGVPDAVG